MSETLQCRICGNRDLISILDLGNQPLSSVFPDPDAPDPGSSPLELVLCGGDASSGACRLLQMRHTANLTEMYGTTYGYRSSTSPTMREHLSSKVDALLEAVPVEPGDVVLDIGCNDGTLLNYYGPERKLDRIGMDPSALKFAGNYQKGIRVLYDFFSADAVRSLIKDKKCRIITSIAMLYDIEDPQSFIHQIAGILARDGIWAFEQSYTPMLMRNLTYDQVCHEHVTYLDVRLIAMMLKRAGMRVIDVQFNEMNGGSFYVQACHQDAPYESKTERIESILASERVFETNAPYERFAQRVHAHRDQLRWIISLLGQAGKTVYGYGASTKGNVTLNFCGLEPGDLTAVCDAQAEKTGKVTPGSRIPIVSKQEMRETHPDYLLVFIWHFRREVILEELDYLENGGKMIFVLPRIHVIDASNYKQYLDQPFSDIGFTL